MLMSLTLAEGKTIAIRFIFAGCCARAASGHVAAAPKSVMNSRRRMYPLREKLIDTSSLTLFDRAAGEKGQPIDPRRSERVDGAAADAVHSMPLTPPFSSAARASKNLFSAIFPACSAAV